MADVPHEVELALLRADVDQMKEDIKALRADISDLVTAWRTATNVLVFVKWTAGLGTALAAFWAIVKGKVGLG